MTESLFRRLLLRFALVPAVALCLFLGVLGFRLHRISAYRIMTADATATLLATNHLYATMIEEETGIRGYLLTRDTKFLDPYQAAASRFAAELQDLIAVVADDPAQGARVGNITRNFRDFDAVNAALLKPGASGQEIDRLLGRQKAAMDRLRVEFAGLTAIENGYRDTGRQAVNELFGTLPALGIGGGVLVAVLLIWHGIYLFRQITTAFRRQLAESEAQRDSLHTTLQSIADAVIVCDPKGHITLMNPTAEQLTGWTTVRALGQPLDRVFKTIDGSSKTPMESPIARLEKLGAVAEPANHTLLVRQDGAEIPIDDRAAPIRDARGRLIGTILVFRSVAERKQAEAALLQSEKLAAVGRLAATIAHEINNPLESVTNLLYLARMGKEIPEVYGHLDLAERELRRVSVITTQTLRFHKQSTRPRAVTTAELFESVLLMYQGRLANDRVLLERRERAGKPVVCFDGEIRQVLNNLVGNALDALEPRGGVLFLRSTEGREWKTGRTGIVVTVADTGGGISRQTLRKIFDPFFTTKGPSGTGLGLWVSKEIVDRHHGVLRVRSRPQPGRSWTVFRLFLPHAP